ncbi:unnamed protein product [Amoebophrya sp. A25]|nr:unnamed protein product [Amoebophrya sp. A25]|eukprot:GSA25T00001460001.1
MGSTTTKNNAMNNYEQYNAMVDARRMIDSQSHPSASNREKKRCICDWRRIVFGFRGFWFLFMTILGIVLAASLHKMGNANINMGPTIRPLDQVLDGVADIIGSALPPAMSSRDSRGDGEYGYPDENPLTTMGGTLQDEAFRHIDESLNMSAGLALDSVKVVVEACGLRESFPNLHHVFVSPFVEELEEAARVQLLGFRVRIGALGPGWVRRGLQRVLSHLVRLLLLLTCLLYLPQLGLSWIPCCSSRLKRNCFVHICLWGLLFLLVAEMATYLYFGISVTRLNNHLYNMLLIRGNQCDMATVLWHADARGRDISVARNIVARMNEGPEGFERGARFSIEDYFHCSSFAIGSIWSAIIFYMLVVQASFIAANLGALFCKSGLEEEEDVFENEMKQQRDKLAHDQHSSGPGVGYYEVQENNQEGGLGHCAPAGALYQEYLYQYGDQKSRAYQHFTAGDEDDDSIIHVTHDEGPLDVEAEYLLGDRRV